MDESAIRLIQDTAISSTGQVQSALPEHTVAMPCGMELIDLEKYLHNRTRFRGAFVTESLADFVAYVRESVPEEPRLSSDRPAAEGFINADKHSAKVFFNLTDADGQPGHGDWTATLALKATAAYKALVGIDGKPMTQRELIDWLQDWYRNVVNIVGDDAMTMSLSQTLSAVRVLNIASKKDSTHVQGDRQASRSALEEVEARAKGAFPDLIYFRCVPYLGLPERDFVMRVGVLTDHDEPRFKLRMAEREAGEEAIAQDFKDELGKRLADACSLTVGTFTP